MKKVLVVMREYPGLGGWIAVPLIRYLPQYGIEPVIITNKSRAQKINQSLHINQQQEPFEVHRAWCMTKSPFRVFSHYFHSKKAAAFLDRFCFVPDTYVTTVIPMYLIARTLVLREGIDTVVTVSPPESLHLTGMLLKKLMGLNWIADFEDLWSTRKHVYKPPTMVHDKLIRSLEQKMYTSADHILANTYGNQDLYRHQYGIPAEKISVIHGGYDPKEQQKTTQCHTNGTFKIGYMGKFDKSGFPWQQVLMALKKLIAEDHIENIQLNVCGFMSKKAQHFIKKNGLQKNVIWHGIFPHAEARRRTCKNNILLAMHFETEYSDRVVPCKLYHYLGMKRPILGVADNHGEFSEIIHKTQTGRIISARNVDRISETIKSCYNQWQQGQLQYQPNYEEMAAYDLTRIAEKMAGIIEHSEKLNRMNISR